MCPAPCEKRHPKSFCIEIVLRIIISSMTSCEKGKYICLYFSLRLSAAQIIPGQFDPVGTPNNDVRTAQRLRK